jgi:hypothetical protein
MYLLLLNLVGRTGSKGSLQVIVEICVQEGAAQQSIPFDNQSTLYRRNESGGQGAAGDESPFSARLIVWCRFSVPPCQFKCSEISVTAVETITTDLLLN